MTPATTATEPTEATYTTVGPLDAWIPWTGRAVLVGDTQVAVFRLADDEFLAIGNRDPFSEANVLARGIVGNEGITVKVASPVLKQRFDLRTGVCLDDPDVRVPTYRVRVTDGHVELAVTADA